MVKSRKVNRIPVARTFKKGYSQKWLMGEETWQCLGDDVLSKQGKVLVSEDPDLSIETLRRLALLQDGTMVEIPFTFGAGDPDKDNDIGIALLSTCIKDNLSATWAELIARYAAIRRYPFLETAIALKALDEQRGLYYFADGTQLPTLWHPRKARMQPGDIVRNANLEDEWDLLAVGRTLGI